MSVCDKNCWDCVFRTTLRFYGIVCNFLGVMGRRRECPAGKGCEQKIAGKKRESLEARLYKMPPNPERKAAPAEDDLSTAARSPSPEGEAKAEEAARIAEKKRKKAEQHRAWVARNREHLREYQQEYRRKKMENEALTPSGATRQLPHGGSQDGGAA